MMIEKARLKNKAIGIWGQAPSVSQKYVEFLINAQAKIVPGASGYGG